MSNFIQWANFPKILPYAQLFKQGLVVTVLLSLFTVMIGFVLALILAVMRLSNFRPFRSLGLDKDGHLRDGGFLLALSKFNPLDFLATAYVEILRSTPVLVQILIIYYGVFSVIKLPSFMIFGFIKFERFFPGVVAMGKNFGAYLCEIIRSGLQSIDGGQTEAARSLGLSSWQSMRLVVLPQAIKNVLPALANEVVTMVKESSICSVLGMAEIMYTAQTVSGNSYITLAPYVLAALVYFCINYPASKAIEAIERRMRRGDKQ